MTTLTVSIYADGTLHEQLTDAADPPAHLTFDTDGVTLLTSVAASPAELDMLFQASAAQTAAQAGVTLSGSGPPSNSLGVDGQTYVDRDSNFAYGPKAGGVWPVGATVALARA